MGTTMSTISASPAEAAETLVQPKPAPETPAPAASQPSPAAVPPEEPPQEGSDEEEAAAGTLPGGKFLLFNAIPSWMVSGVVHFIALLVLAAMTVNAKLPETTLSINAPPVQKMEEIEELKEEKIELKIDTTVVSDQREIVQQALQDVVDPTSTPSIAADADAA